MIMEITVVLTMLTRTTVKAAGLLSRIPASRVSIKVVMLAPMIYGITFSRRIKPRSLNGTNKAREILTDMDIMVTMAPRINITIGRKTRFDTHPNWLSLSVISGKHLSKRLKLTTITAKPSKKTAQYGNRLDASPVMGVIIRSTIEITIAPQWSCMLSNKPVFRSNTPISKAGK